MSEPTTSPAASPLRVSTEPRPAHDPTEALAAALDGLLPRMAFRQYGADFTADPDFDVMDYYRRVAAELVAAGWHLTRDGDEAELRTAARRLVDTTDALARWDEAHGYIINSERDALAGDVSQGWAGLSAALDSDR